MRAVETKAFVGVNGQVCKVREFTVEKYTVAEIFVGPMSRSFNVVDVNVVRNRLSELRFRAWLVTFQVARGVYGSNGARFMVSNDTTFQVVREATAAKRCSLDSGEP